MMHIYNFAGHSGSMNHYEKVYPVVDVQQLTHSESLVDASSQRLCSSHGDCVFLF